MKPLRILIGCDAPLRESLRRTLASQPAYSICGQAPESQDIPAAVREQHPDVVLVDLTSPLSAIDAIRRVREIHSDIEVLGLVAFDPERTMREAWLAGARGLVLKAHANEQIVPALAALAEKKPYVESELAVQVLPGLLTNVNQSATMGGRTPHLTPREREIVQLVADGRTSKEIAAALALSPKTVEAHRASILKKLNIRSASQMVLHAVRNNIISA